MVVTLVHRLRRGLGSRSGGGGLPLPPGPRLFLYLHRELLPPTFLALAGFTLALLTKDLLGFADLVINRGLGTGAVAQIAFYQAVPLAAQTLPFAVLVGTLAGLGRWMVDRERLAMESLGVSVRQLAVPAAHYGAWLGAATLALALWGTPWAARSLDAALLELARSAPGSAIRAAAIAEFGDHQLEVRQVSARGDHFEGVMFWAPGIGDTVFARSGDLVTREDGSLELALHDGAILRPWQRGGGLIRFAGATTALPAPAPPTLPDETDSLRALDLDGLRAAARRDGGGEAEALRAGLELHRRMALPAAAPLFALLAVPLALLPARLSRSGGALIGIGVTVVYYGLLQLGNGLAQGGTLPLAVAAWLPNVLLAAAALLLLLRADGRPLEGTRLRLGAWRRRVLHAPARLRTRPLDGYVALLFLEMVAVAFAALVAAYLVVDLLERLDWFARHRATLGEAAYFYTARAWLLAARVFPMALLVGCALAVGRITANGELLAMRACGIPALRGLRPILLVAAAAIPVSWVLNDAVLPQTNARADRIKESRIKDRPQQAVRTDLWYRSGDAVYRIDRLDPAEGRAQGVTRIELDAEGMPVARSDAASARHVGAGLWELVGVERVEVGDPHTRRVDAPSPISLGEEPGDWVDSMHLSARDLLAFIRETERDGFDARRLRVDLHVKLAAPLACLLLPAVVLLFAVGGPPAPRPSRTFLLALALGVGHVLVTGVAAALGYGGVLPPALAGWGVTVVLAGAGAGLAFGRARE